jgi:two-component system chemotaxis response regulator CheB
VELEGERTVSLNHVARVEAMMANRDIVAIGTSAGGVEALLHLASHLPREFPASILVTIHLSSQFRSALDDVLTRGGKLPATFANDSEPLREGRIYIAPPDRHLLLLEADRLLLGTGARENNFRPAIDSMLRSAAACCGPRTIGVVLTGTMSDGASGLWAINRCGGVSVVQDPRDSAFPEMPINALNRTEPDHVVRLTDMPALLANLVRQPAGAPQPVPESLRFEVDIARGARATMDEMDRIGRRSVLACPDCHGVMWEIDEGELIRYRCHVGHTYTAELMSVALDDNLRRALGIALRALEERLALATKLQRQAEQRQHNHLAASWSQKAQEAKNELDLLRASIDRLEAITAGTMMRRAG